MGGGGKSSTSTSSVDIPPQILANYQTAFSKALSASNAPFQQYGGQFVAPLTSTQNAGISNVNAAANEAQPYYQTAQGLAGQGAAATAAVQPLTADQINQYENPYLSQVLGSTESLINQQNQQAQAGQLGSAISSGAFGGDRAGVAAANLNQQQELAAGNIYSGISADAYNQAVQTAQQQQQFGLAQANQLGQFAQLEGGLGSAAQQAALEGAQAQLSAGQVQQQTQQAEDTALYNQFLQQQSYPFQTAQFLANIAEGTGSLSGSTTTTTQPGGFFSDERLKEDIEPVGETYDGQKIIRFRYKGDPRTQIGLSAQKVEKKHPKAVGLAGGYRTVDYEKATDDAAHRGHFADGGVPDYLQAQAEMYAPFSQAGLYGGQSGGLPRGGLSYVPVASVPVAGLHPAPAPSGNKSSGVQNVQQLANLGREAEGFYNDYEKWSKDHAKPKDKLPAKGSLTDQPGGLSPSAPPPADLSASADTAAAANTVADSAATDAATQAATQAAQDAAEQEAANYALSAMAARGGRQGRADGGGLDIPEDSQPYHLATSTPPKDDSSQQDMQALMSAASIAAMFFANRGGRINKDAGGSLPYDYSAGVVGAPGSAPGSTAGGLSIPNQHQGSSELQVAPTSPPPSMLSKLTSSPIPPNWQKAGQAHGWQRAKDIWENFNLAPGDLLARGGVAGRHGYATDGSVDDPLLAPKASLDSVDAPDVKAGLGAADSTPAVPQEKVTPEDKKDSIWDKVGHVLSSVSDAVPAKYAIPLLTGVAAMGTAPTRNWGTALAAGLGAGAQAYVPTQQQEANVAKTQEEAQQIDIANQMSQLGLNAAKSALSPTAERAKLPTPVRPEGMAPGEVGDPQELGFQKFAPLPSARPDAITSKITALTLAGKPEAAKTIGDQYDQQLLGANQNRKLGANAAYLNYAAIADAEPRAALSMLARQDPQKAKQILSATTDPAAQDQQARDWAARMGFAAHQWSDRPTDMQNGVLIDKMTGTPVVGQHQVMTGLSQEGRQAAFNEGMTPVVLGNRLPGFKYQQSGYKSIDQFVLAQDRIARQNMQAANAPVGAPQTPAQAAAPVTGSQVAPTAQPPQRAQATPVVRAPVPPSDPVLAKALADPAWRQKPLPPVVDQTSRQNALELQTINNTNRKDVLRASDIATEAAAQSLQFLDAAKSIMDSKGATVGIYGGLVNKAGQLLGGTPKSTDYQELGKYLINAAIAAGKANFENPTQSEVGLQINEASPSKEMDAETINRLLKTNIRAAKYTMDSANRAKAYLDQGNDPINFNKWNNTYFPRDKYILAPTATDAGGKWYFYNGKWVR